MSKFDREWNVTGRTWIEVSVPGPWAVENTVNELAYSKSWRIINTETGSSKKIGPISMKGVNYFDKAVAEAEFRNEQLLKAKESDAPAQDYVTRYVVTVPCKDGIGRTLLHAAQGRYTYATPEEAQAWIDGYLSNNSEATLNEFGRDVQVRPCKCYPGHFDPMGVYFDMPSYEDIVSGDK